MGSKVVYSLMLMYSKRVLLETLQLPQGKCRNSALPIQFPPRHPLGHQPDGCEISKMLKTKFIDQMLA